MKGAVGDAWKYIRDIQRGRAGLKPTKPKAVRKLDGALCTTPVEVCKDGNNILTLFRTLPVYYPLI